MERFQAARAFMAENFWSLDLVLKPDSTHADGASTGSGRRGGAGAASGRAVKLLWERQRIFDRITTLVLGELA